MARRVTNLSLSPTAAEILERIPARQRSAWVSSLIERAKDAPEGSAEESPAQELRRILKRATQLARSLD